MPASRSAAQPHQVIGDGAVALQPGDEAVAGLRIEKSVGLERTHVGFRRIGRIPEHQFEMGIRGRRPCVRPVKRADVDTLVDSFEQPRERFDVRGQLRAHWFAWRNLSTDN